MDDYKEHQKAILSGTVATLISSLAVVLAWRFAPIHSLFLIVGLIVSVLLGLGIFLVMYRLIKHQYTKIDALEFLLTLSRDEEVSAVHKQISRYLVAATKRKDTIFRQLLLQRLHTLADDIRSLGNGRIEFTSTESWRVFYEQILRSPGKHLYRSVSLIQTQDYWQDGVGRNSTDLNLELHDAGTLSVERIAIISDHLWNSDELFPVRSIHEWLEEQHRYGIWLTLVKESQLQGEQELIADFGIYGNRAVGRQIADAGGRTTRFTLSFDNADIEKADSIWKRLNVFSVSYSELLDQQH